MDGTANLTGTIDRPAARPRKLALPWNDAAGRFSPFKLAVLILLCVPAAWIAVDLATGAIGPRPINQAVHEIGNWTLKLILISLAVTPARRLWHWNGLIQIRRMVGVAAFAYVAAHLVLYMADEAFDLQKVATEIVLRVYLAIGFIALLILTAMAVTSTDGMTRRLGGKRWRRLHQLVYLAALLGVIHFFMQTKSNVDEPWVMAGLFAFLMFWRAVLWLRDKKRRPGLWTGLALAPAAALITAGGEAIYYWLKLGAPIDQVLMSNVMWDLAPRPSLIVLGICLAFALAGPLRVGLSKLQFGHAHLRTG